MVEDCRGGSRERLDLGRDRRRGSGCGNDRTRVQRYQLGADADRGADVAGGPEECVPRATAGPRSPPSAVAFERADARAQAAVIPQLERETRFAAGRIDPRARPRRGDGARQPGEGAALLNFFSIGGLWTRRNVGGKVLLGCKRILELTLTSCPANVNARTAGVAAVVGVKSIGGAWVPDQYAAVVKRRDDLEWLAGELRKRNRRRTQDLIGLQLAVADLTATI